MSDDTSAMLATLIKSVGKDKAEKIVLAAYRLGFLDGQATMARTAEEKMQSLLDLDGLREAGL